MNTTNCPVCNEIVLFGDEPHGDTATLRDHYYWHKLKEIASKGVDE